MGRIKGCSGSSKAGDSVCLSVLPGAFSQRKAVLLLLVAGASLLCVPAHGQWMTQSFTLQPGWNAVFLEVAPSPQACDALFEGVPVEAVCGWNQASSPVQYISDPDEAVEQPEDWLLYFPVTHPKRVLNSLNVLHGGKPYLIHLGGGAPVNWDVKGVATLRATKWRPDSFNLVGFYTESSGGPTFFDYFAPSPAHAGQPVYQLNNATGKWQLVSNPAATRPQKGRAYWVYTEGQSKYQGPLAVGFVQGAGLKFGDILSELGLTLENSADVATPCTLSPGVSEVPVGEGVPDLAGVVPLSFWDPATLAWAPLTSKVLFTVPAGGHLKLRLGVRRSDMAAYTGGSPDYLYQSLLNVSTPGGIRYPIAVTARGVEWRGASTKTPADPRAGLWVGTAVLTKVAEKTPFPAPGQPRPVGSEFEFRIILHVDATGTVRFLQEVIQMWKEGTTTPAPGNPTFQTVDQQGEYVLLTDASLIPNYGGAAVRDGVPVGRRISTAAFAFDAPIPMMGNFPAPGETTAVVGCDILLDYDDPMNPFKHAFHPDHDNWTAFYEEEDKHPEGVESYTIARDIELEFTENDPDGLPLPDWGSNHLGGIYRETLHGLHRTLSGIDVEGTFRIQRVSTVAELDPAP